MDTKTMKNQETAPRPESPVPSGHPDSPGQEQEWTKYMSAIICQLVKDRKRAAVHTYTAVLHSYTAFAEEKKYFLLPEEIFTPGRLKEYEEHLRTRQRTWNTVSTYMRTLKAVYNRFSPPGSPGHSNTLFNDVYTRVESQTKRALEEEEMEKVMEADYSSLNPGECRTLAYFSLMFLLCGMPFIDMAYMQKKDLKRKADGSYELVYLRHKTQRNMRIAVPPEAVPLLQACLNKSADSIFLFPILDGSLMKQDDKLHQNYLAALRRFNRALATLGTLLLPAGIKLSSYTPRHSWATIHFRRGTPLGIISKALGHSSIRVTENYLKPYKDEEVSKANLSVTTSFTGKIRTNSAFCHF